MQIRLTDINYKSRDKYYPPNSNDNSKIKPQELSDLSVWNPYTYEYCKTYPLRDLSKSQTITYLSDKYKKDYTRNIDLKYEPCKFEVIKDKVTGEDINVAVLESINSRNPDQFSLHFLSDDLKKEYGFAAFSKHTLKPEGEEKSFFKNFFIKEKRDVIDKDYPERRLVGSRIELEYVQNCMPDNINGISELANKYAVLHCMSNNIPPNIVSYSHSNSHTSLYLNGFRFLPLDKNSKEGNFFLQKYGVTNPNKVMENLLKTTPVNEIDTSGWGDLGMYLPSNVVNKYLKNYTALNLKIKNPYWEVINEGFVCVDLTKDKKFRLNGTNPQDALIIEYSPRWKGQLIDRETGKPFDVAILKLHNVGDKERESFFFMSKDLSHEYGHVELNRNCKEYCDNYEVNDLAGNYVPQGVKGDRIVVEWLENNNTKDVGGVGILADKLAVQYCLEKGIKPNIVSYPAPDSHVAHYLRGKRFIQPEKGTDEYKFLSSKYGDSNPNRVLNRLIKKSNETGEPVDLEGWGYLVMYMPQTLINKYKKEIEDERL